MVKMTKCRLNVHTGVTREGVVNTPTGPAASCFWDPLLIDSAHGILTVFSTDQLFDVLHLVMTETGI